MSRTVDVNNPDDWSEEDKVWLAQRMDQVPEQHRHLVSPPAPVPPGVTPGITPQMVRLTAFVKDKFPHRGDEDPVDVVISELGGDETEDDEADDYPDWKVAELRAEAEKRDIDQSTFPTGNDAKTKAPWIALLRDWDKNQPVL